jgi:hypothetical protein
MNTGMPCSIHTLMILQEKAKLLLPFFSLDHSDADRFSTGRPIGATLERNDFLRARLHVVQGVPRNTAEIQPDVSQPRMRDSNVRDR